MKRSSQSGLRFRPRLETFEDRAVPATFTSYGINSPYQGLEIVQQLTPMDTDNDPSDFEKATFVFRDTDSDIETVALLVFKKYDDTTPYSPGGVDKSAQTLIGYVTVDTTRAVNQEYTLEIQLPSCQYQVDATFVPGGTLDLGSPIGYATALANNLDGAIGTNPCPPGGPEGEGGFDPHTQGYWKTHGPDPTGNNGYVWPEVVKQNGMSLGGRMYTADQLLTLFRTQPRGNGAISMAHQLIAAKLNLAAGATPSQTVLDAINAADVLIGSGNLLTGFSLAPSATSGLTSTLDAFNNS